MRLLQQINQKVFYALSIMALLMGFCGPVQAADATIDRAQLVTQQINLLKNRYDQEQRELEVLKARSKDLSSTELENANKSLLDKSNLEIAVSTSNLDSITIELNDSQQTIAFLEKNIQEIQNQLNVLGIFGVKLSTTDTVNIKQLRQDLTYQQKLLSLEKQRDDYLLSLQSDADNILQLQKDRYTQINTYLKSRNLLHIKQQQVQDELAFQEQQNRWLQTLENLYIKIATVNPQSKLDYGNLEREIFYANEMASFSYYQSLIARYKDEAEQMKLAVQRSSSITLLNEISDQTQVLSKQIQKLDELLKSRAALLEKHVSYLSDRQKDGSNIADYLIKLNQLKQGYQTVDKSLVGLNTNLSQFRTSVDHDLQVELSARQGFPSFNLKTLLDIGKEMLLVPTLSYHVMKNMTTQTMSAFKSMNPWWWLLFAMIEVGLIVSFIMLRNTLRDMANQPSDWRDTIHSKWIGLQWLRRNLSDLFVIGNAFIMVCYFSIPIQNFMSIFYLSLVWLVAKSINTIARLYLAENTHDARGDDMRLYKRLRWLVWIGAFITGLTVFVYQLPMIFELKTLCDRLFLFLLMVVSLFLLRSWYVVPNLIMAQMDYRHPYLRRSMALVSILIPLLMLGNAIIGLCGYVNLIMTVSWYEGVFLCVLIAYLIFRGLLSNGLEQVSRLVIQYVNNGWLWTEAILKPLDRILRIALFLTSWAVLFIFYGWDNQSPIVVRLKDLLHYQLINVLNTSITPLNIIELCVVIAIFYWAAKWTREFIFRILSSRSKDMGIRNSIAILSQYSVVVLGIFLCLRLLGIDLRALAFVASMFALGVGMGLRDLVNNFACGFLILLERPIRVGDIVNINNIEGEVAHIGSRAVTVRTWDNMHMLVPNTEIFNKSFINWTATDNIVRSIGMVPANRDDNPHLIQELICNVLAEHKEVLKEPGYEVLLQTINETVMVFEIRYYVNIRQVKSRISVMSAVLNKVWDSFVAHDIKPAYAFQEILLTKKEPAQLVNLKERLENG